MAAFATNAQFLTRYDARTTGDLVADDGNRVSSGDLATDANLTVALQDASGLILTAASVGNRYTEADLAAITGNDAAILQRITCDLAFAYLRQRRGYDIDQFTSVQESFALLDRIRLGERVFGDDDVRDKHNAQAPVVPSYTIFDDNRVRDYATRFYTQRRFRTDQ